MVRGQATGLGERFIATVDKAIADITKGAAHNRLEGSAYRLKVVKTFPYVILYEILQESHEIYIEAIYHAKRNPESKFRRDK